MYGRLLGLLGLALVFSQNANATTYFDTIGAVNVANLNQGTDGASEGATYVAQSFAVSGTPDLSVTLALSTMGTTGSVLVFIVPDDGSSGFNNVAGYPSTVGNGSGMTGYDPLSVQIGAVLDSTLSQDATNPTLVSFGISGSTLAQLSVGNNEYWIGIILEDGSSAEWSTTSEDPGIGTNGQSYFDDAGNSFGNSYDLSFGEPELTVQAPEPATLAIIGSGLFGLGVFRRRKSSKKLADR
jgi:hypothetical protein